MIKGNLEIPELDRLEKVQSSILAIRGFIEWLQQEKRITLGSDQTYEYEWRSLTNLSAEPVIKTRTEYARVITRIEALIMEYFDLNENKLEEERQLILQLFNNLQNG